MKNLLPIFILSIIVNYAFAQDLHGLVLDSANLTPIAHAKIIAKGVDVYSDENGVFTLENFNRPGNRFSIRTDIYKTIEVLITDQIVDTLVIRLHARPVRLREVETGLQKADMNGR